MMITAKKFTVALCLSTYALLCQAQIPNTAELRFEATRWAMEQDQPSS